MQVSKIECKKLFEINEKNTKLSEPKMTIFKKYNMYNSKMDTLLKLIAENGDPKIQMKKVIEKWMKASDKLQFMRSTATIIGKQLLIFLDTEFNPDAEIVVFNDHTTLEFMNGVTLKVSMAIEVLQKLREKTDDENLQAGIKMDKQERRNIIKAYCEMDNMDDILEKFPDMNKTKLLQVVTHAYNQIQTRIKAYGSLDLLIESNARMPYQISRHLAWKLVHQK